MWMRALVPLYRLLACLRALPYRMGLLRAVRIPVPLVVVGNVSVGGTGKTPLVLALVEFLRKRGWNPGVVSRGHGGSERGPRLLDETATPHRVGDEPCLMHRRGVPVAIGRRRDHAALLLPSIGVDVIIADDGLQNPALARDLEICVLDGARRLGNGHLLPAGPLRESPERLARVDFVVCNGQGAGRNEIAM
ncbi:MAG: tetraacyldisaccharide 4'-kinase, partial [Dokdonella sp.]|nr:tetraacyldisaccharide 4'-kinase [Dokdonella sp.]